MLCVTALISAATADQACSMAALPNTKCTHVPFARSTEASADACLRRLQLQLALPAVELPRGRLGEPY
jgi:hypothetical protein